MLHLDACRDLLEGNVKGVMKVILAIAERYQPKSVKPRTVVPETLRPANHTAPLPDSQYGIRQELVRPYTHPQTPIRPDQIQSSFHSSGLYPSPYPVDPATEGMYSSPIDTLPANKPPQVISGKKKPPPPPVMRSRTGSAGMYGIPEEIGEECEGPVGVVRAEERAGLSGEIGAVVSGLSQFKAELLQLHAVLLRNNDGIRDVGGSGEMGKRGEVGERGWREKECEEEIVSLRDQLGHLQDECTQAEAECTALRNMVEERNAFITTMKSEIYRKEYLNDTQKAELHTQLMQKDTHIKKLETDLADCHGNLEAKETELEAVRVDLERSQATMEQNRAEVEQLQAELGRVSASEEKLTQRLSAKDKKLLASEERLSEEREKGTRRTQLVSEYLEALAEGLAQLTSDPSQTEQLEGLRKKVADMAGRLDQPLPSSPGRRRRRDRESDDPSRHRRKRRGDRGGQNSDSAATPSSPNTTRVLYYMAGESKTEVPFVAIVPKRAAEVTLRDFKEAFGRHGDYRFFFKTEDPDCGIVKEEILSDEQMLPILKGKVTAWIRERETTAAVGPAPQ
ncbi:Dixin-A [Geodia barretti]|nr:Dixin-A [Geodia barretti]